ncbi:MAG: glycosyltransferase, partial [Methylococcales bacterium]
MLSVIIITKNESEHIARCLTSVSWADEIIVFDSGSTDNTVSICKQFTPHVYQTDWPGFGPQKNRALQ